MMSDKYEDTELQDEIAQFDTGCLHRSTGFVLMRALVKQVTRSQTIADLEAIGDAMMHAQHMVDRHEEEIFRDHQGRAMKPSNKRLGDDR